MAKLRVSNMLFSALGCYMVAHLFLGPSNLIGFFLSADVETELSHQLASLEQERDVLQKRADLARPGHMSEDYLQELAYKRAGMAQPDVIVVPLDTINPALARAASPLPNARAGQAAGATAQ